MADRVTTFANPVYIIPTMNVCTWSLAVKFDLGFRGMVEKHYWRCEHGG